MVEGPWHFERTLTLLAHGPTQALTLFAPRRTGRTEILLKDLAPLAEDGGHRVIYASFWQAPLSPLAVLLHALETALRQESFMDGQGAEVGDGVRTEVEALRTAARCRGGGRGRSHRTGGEAAGRAVAPSRRSP